jgi:hypothetical protein
MQIYAPFNDRKSQSSTLNLTDVASTMEGFKQTLLVFEGNTNTFILDVKCGDIVFAA